ncbi:HNH endonuclease family protein [Gordonia phosphorivorans]|uniref:HNH endonuclease family protein n=1 Tax=Gordonia phosphorivorans TaxID=1056982 RepID=A0ABV6H499_9ACTN
MRSPRRTALALVLATATVLTGTSCAALDIDLSPVTPKPAAQHDPLTPVDARDALADLETLAVKGRAPKTGYSRSQFGRAWTDDVDVEGGGNSCSTRDDLLAIQLSNVQLRPGTCVVVAGTLDDPYSGDTIEYRRGRGSLVDLDHVVALGDAWQKGAQQLTLRERTNLANDPINLLAVSASENRRKKDSDTASWIPPNKTFRCQYVSMQIAVKKRYRLWVTKAEKAAMTNILNRC